MKTENIDMYDQDNYQLLIDPQIFNVEQKKKVLNSSPSLNNLKGALGIYEQRFKEINMKLNELEGIVSKIFEGDIDWFNKVCIDDILDLQRALMKQIQILQMMKVYNSNDVQSYILILSKDLV